MKSVTMEHLTKCGIKSKEVASECSVSDAVIVKWKKQGYIPEQRQKIVKAMLLRHAKIVNLTVKSLGK